jgi:hypothetical protein
MDVCRSRGIRDQRMHWILEGFKSSKTLLLEADADGLRALAETFRSLAAGTLTAVVPDELPFMEVHHGVDLLATRSTHDRGIRRADVENVFLWERTAEGWQDSAERVDALTKCAQGHHYLDGAEDQVIVQISKGEYGDEWWRRHG